VAGVGLLNELPDAKPVIDAIQALLPDAKNVIILKIENNG
jgi:ABC-type uncharacterized transport system substrate-binding protein